MPNGAKRLGVLPCGGQIGLIQQLGGPAVGYASYLEDILNRLGHDLRGLGATLDASGWSTAREVEARKLLRRSEELVYDILQHWEYATDPHLDLAHELVRVKQERAKAIAECERFQDDVAALRRELADAKKANRALDKALHTAKRERRRTKEVLEAAFEEDPARIYEQYTKPDQIARRRMDK